jgi:hypothetical protein
MDIERNSACFFATTIPQVLRKTGCLHVEKFLPAFI